VGKISALLFLGKALEKTNVLKCAVGFLVCVVTFWGFAFGRKIEAQMLVLLLMFI
jgi:hypothetical protein